MTKRSLLWAFIALSLVLFIGYRFMATSSQKKFNVGIIQIIDHPALDNTRQGIIDQLSKSGLTPDNTQIIYESAQGNATMATQIAQKLVAQVDVIVTLGTTPTQAAAQITLQSAPKIPIVFASVTDPVGSKIITNMQKPEKNVTGVSNYVDVLDQIQFFKTLYPSLKRLGIIYNPGETNSVTLIERTKKIAQELGLVLEFSCASKTSDVATATQNLIGKVDAIFINNDNTALSAFDAIAKICKENTLPLFVSDTDCVEKGALASLGANQYTLGEQAGDMVVELIKNKKSVQDIPAQGPRTKEKRINEERLNALKDVLKMS